MNKEKIQLKDFSLSEMEDWAKEMGEQAFRGRQLFQWIWEKGIVEFSQITNLSKSFIQQLEEKCSLDRSTTDKVQTSSTQGTSKFLIKLNDGKFVETVLIPEERRVTVCLSSQVGCALDCDFCATGKMGLKRNLSSGEIADQLLHVRRFSDRPITNIVFMGMGEPFHNYEQVIRAANILNSDLGFAHGARKITISTSGMVPQIIRFADEGHRYKLAVSLNASNDLGRSQIMPINNKWPITELIKACKHYTQTSKNMLTFEYVLLNEVNDGIGDAKRLLKIANQVFCKVNVIPYNDPSSSVTSTRSSTTRLSGSSRHSSDRMAGTKADEVVGGYARPSKKRITTFLDTLEGSQFPVTVRWSQGDDIDAACGQLSTAAQSGDRDSFES